MSVVKDIDRRMDVICQNCKDGSIIPLKIKVTDETGETQQFRIKEYRELITPEYYEMPNGAKVRRSRAFREFECKIIVFERERLIRIMYNIERQTWIYK